MTFNTPLWLQAGSYAASDDRRMLGAISTEGTPFAGALLVAQRAAGINMSVDVAIGSAWVQQGQSSDLYPKMYFCTSTAITNVTIPTASGTTGQSRNDLVGIQVRDNSVDGSGFNDWYLRVVAGTPATTGSQVDPTEPDSFLPLARVTVVYNATSISNSVITDLRPQSALPGQYSNAHVWSASQNFTGGIQGSNLTLTGTVSAPAMSEVTSNNIALNGQSATAVVSTDVITTPLAHGLAVGSMVSFSGGGSVTGFTINTAYWVKTVPSSTTLTISATASGSAIDLTGTDGSMGVMSTLLGGSGGTPGASALEATQGVQFVAPPSGRVSFRWAASAYVVTTTGFASIIPTVGVYSWNGTTQTAITDASNYVKTGVAYGGSTNGYGRARITDYDTFVAGGITSATFVNAYISNSQLGEFPEVEFVFDRLTPGTTYRMFPRYTLGPGSTAAGIRIYPRCSATMLS